MMYVLFHYRLLSVLSTEYLEPRYCFDNSGLKQFWVYFQTEDFLVLKSIQVKYFSEINGNLSNITYKVASKPYSLRDRKFRPKDIQCKPLKSNIDYKSGMNCRRKHDDSICEGNNGYSFGRGSANSEVKLNLEFIRKLHFFMRSVDSCRQQHLTLI